MANNLLSLVGKSLLSSIPRGRGSGWSGIIHDPYPGAWQQNNELLVEDKLSYPAVYACMTLIANDISKLGVNLETKDEEGIWNVIENPAYSPVLTKQNGYQTRIQFFSNWLLSLYTYGNAIILKKRDQRGVVNELFVLNPDLVTPYVSDDRQVFYQLNGDTLANGGESVMVPAREIIHDRLDCLYTQLWGVSPLYAAALSIYQGRKIIESNSHFFKNHGRPGGVLTAPGNISDETVRQLKADWETNYTGNNSGRVAVLADGLKYEAFNASSAADSLVIDQLGWTAKVVASVFHIPAYMIGADDMPSYDNVEVLTMQYYMQTLQARIENIELLLAEGLNLPKNMRITFDVNDLWRMDTASLIEAQKEAVSGGIKKPNEARRTLNLKPINGGDTVYLQQQMFSLEALSKRDARDDPFAKDSSATTTTPNTNNDETLNDDAKEFITQLRTKSAERFLIYG